MVLCCAAIENPPNGDNQLGVVDLDYEDSDERWTNGGHFLCWTLLYFQLEILCVDGRIDG